MGTLISISIPRISIQPKTSLTVHNVGIHVWIVKRKRNPTTCPICRKVIISKTPNLVLDSNIEQFISRYFPENLKKARGVHLISQRIPKKETEILPPAQTNSNKYIWSFQNVPQSIRHFLGQYGVVFPSYNSANLINSSHVNENLYENHEETNGNCYNEFDNIVDNVDIDEIVRNLVLISLLMLAIFLILVLIVLSLIF